MDSRTPATRKRVELELYGSIKGSFNDSRAAGILTS